MTDVATSSTPGMGRVRAVAREVLPGALVIVAFLVAWTLYAGVAPGNGKLLPTPVATLVQVVKDWGIISKALLVTLGSALQGLLWGTLVAAACCAVVLLIPGLQRATTRTLTIVYCIPLAAIAPLLFLLLRLPGPHIALAAISVLFPIYISLVSGLTARHEGWEELSGVLGGRRVEYFVRVQVPASTRQLLVAARIAGPAAILGTTLAEYFGGTAGVGVLMINSLAQVNAPRAYALGVVITVVSVLSYAIVGVVERLLPWTEELP